MKAFASAAGTESQPEVQLSKRQRRIWIVGAILMTGLLWGLTGCQSGVTNIPVSPDSETGQAIRRMDYMAAHGGLKPEDEPGYRETAMQFIRYAQAGDVQQMLAMTSAHSYATQSDSVRKVYAEQVVPQFQGTTVTWASKGAFCRDEQNNPGLMFTGTAHGNKTHSFDVVIYKEDGKLVVANIRKHH